MVTRLSLDSFRNPLLKLSFLALLLPAFIFSGEFTASVNCSEVGIGESLTLNLILKNATPKEAPQVSDVKKLFFIHSQQHTSSTVMVNGQVSASIIWKLTLIPQKEGEVRIPSISVATTEGVLVTEPLAIKVVKNKSADKPNSFQQDGIELKAEVSNFKPYKNETIVYTIKLFTKQNIANIKVNKIEFEGAIFEPYGDPKIYEEIIDGIKGGIVEFHYLVTPLKTGRLTIPSAIVEGVIPMKRKHQWGSFFDDEIDLFSIMGGFDQLKPFVYMTEEIALEVLPPIPEVNPWIPAASLKIEEMGSESQLKVGEPINRKFKIVGEGILSHQLPSLETLLVSDSLFKVYADKPELSNEIKDHAIQSLRIEQYTLIPQHAGDYTLPEMSIPWWNTKSHEKEIVIIPSQTVQILPADVNYVNEPIALGSMIEPHSEFIEKEQSGFFAYGLMVSLAVLLSGTIFWVVMLQRKIQKLEKIPSKIALKQEISQVSSKFQKRESQKRKSGAKKEELPDLNPT